MPILTLTPALKGGDLMKLITLPQIEIDPKSPHYIICMINEPPICRKYKP